MKDKEAKARIKINTLLEEAGWRFFDKDNKPANIVLEPCIKIISINLTILVMTLKKPQMVLLIIYF